MKSYFFILILLFGSCSGKQKSQNNQAVKIGADRDAHGCISSAGYVWSELRQECIRPFEIGLKLYGVDTMVQNYAAYLIFSSDSTKVELFSTLSATSILLDYNKEKHVSRQWCSSDTPPYILTHESYIWRVRRNGILLFTSQEPI